MIFAHGEGAFKALPLRPWVAAWAGGASVVAAFLVLYLYWLTPRFADLAIGRRLGRATGVVHDVVVVGLRTVGLALFGVTLYGLWFGNINPAQNLGPPLVYIGLWLAVPLASALLGDVWGALNPYDTIAAIVQRVRTKHWSRTPEPLEGNRLLTSYWPAVIGLLGFIWLELCYHRRWDVRMLGVCVTVYSALVLLGAAHYGRAWLQRSEAFTAYFGLIARVSPVFYDREDRQVRVRWPLTGLADVSTGPGITMLVLVSIGGTTFDASNRLSVWQRALGRSVGWGYTAIQTFGLLWITAAVVIAYLVATAATAWLQSEDRYEAPARYIHALVPVALGFTFAHYLSYVVVEGQDMIRLASDPFGKGWNLFGSVDYVIDTKIVPQSVLSWSRFAGVIAAHIAAVWLVWDRALEDDKPPQAVRTHAPLVAVIVAYCGTAMVLLLT